MCWSGEVLGVTRRKEQVVPSLPQKEEQTQHILRPLEQKQQSLFPNLSFSEIEWLHLHSDTAKSADTSGTTVVSEKSKLLALMKGENKQANRILPLLEGYAILFEYYQGILQFQVRNWVGSYNLQKSHVFKTFIQQPQNSTSQKQAVTSSTPRTATSGCEEIQQRPTHFSKTRPQSHLQFFFSHSQVNIWSGTHRKWKTLKLIYTF